MDSKSLDNDINNDNVRMKKLTFGISDEIVGLDIVSLIYIFL